MKKNPKNSGAGVIFALLLVVLGNLGNIHLTWKIISVIAVIAVIIVLLFVAAKVRKSREKEPSDDLPPEDGIRAMQSRAEERLLDQAKAPDLAEQKHDFSDQAPAERFEYRVGVNDAKKRAAELKSLYEGGIISSDEYRERIRSLATRSGKKI